MYSAEPCGANVERTNVATWTNTSSILWVEQRNDRHQDYANIRECQNQMLSSSKPYPNGGCCNSNRLDPNNYQSFGYLFEVERFNFDTINWCEVSALAATALTN